MSRVEPRAGFPVGEDHEWCDARIADLREWAEDAELRLTNIEIMLSDLARDIRGAYPQWAADLRDIVTLHHEPVCEVRRWFDKPGFGPRARCLCAKPLAVAR